MAGMGLVPEDRKEQGLVTGLSVRQNISMPILKPCRGSACSACAGSGGLRNPTCQAGDQNAAIEQKATYLSGGNQQRLVIAKWLATQPKLLIVDEPTRGVDVGAKAEIHASCAISRKQGMAIMMISSDLPEILAMSDRVLVMYQGRIVADVPSSAATQETIMHHATGHE